VLAPAADDMLVDGGADGTSFRPHGSVAVVLAGASFRLLDLCPRSNWIGSTNGFDGFDPLGY
jgi:hypothetical protein